MHMHVFMPICMHDACVCMDVVRERIYVYIHTDRAGAQRPTVEPTVELSLRCTRQYFYMHVHTHTLYTYMLSLSLSLSLSPPPPPPPTTHTQANLECFEEFNPVIRHLLNTHTHTHTYTHTHTHTHTHTGEPRVL
jgi:hypothetical protein